jgi:hypothetical protein
VAEMQVGTRGRAAEEGCPGSGPRTECSRLTKRDLGSGDRG